MNTSPGPREELAEKARVPAAELKRGEMILSPDGSQLLVTHVARIRDIVAVRGIDQATVREVSEYGSFTVELYEEPTVILTADQPVTLVE